MEEETCMNEIKFGKKLQPTQTNNMQWDFNNYVSCNPAIYVCVCITSFHLESQPDETLTSTSF